MSNEINAIELAAELTVAWLAILALEPMRMMSLRF